MQQVQELLDLKSWIGEKLDHSEQNLEYKFNSTMRMHLDGVNAKFENFSTKNLEEWYTTPLDTTNIYSKQFIYPVLQETTEMVDRDVTNCKEQLSVLPYNHNILTIGYKKCIY